MASKRSLTATKLSQKAAAKKKKAAVAEVASVGQAVAALAAIPRKHSRAASLGAAPSVGETGGDEDGAFGAGLYACLPFILYAFASPRLVDCAIS